MTDEDPDLRARVLLVLEGLDREAARTFRRDPARLYQEGVLYAAKQLREAVSVTAEPVDSEMTLSTLVGHIRDELRRGPS